MQHDFNHYVHKKKRRKRFVTLLIIIMFTATVAVFMRDCSQNMSEPYNKEYIPLDKDASLPMRDIS